MQTEFNEFNGGKISRKTNEVVGKIQNINIVMSDAVGYSGARPEQYNNFIELEAAADNEELLALTKHSNATVRCYAFWALSHRQGVDLYGILLNHINDEELVETQFGCTMVEEMVGDFFINLVTPDYVDLSSQKLDASQFEALDRVLMSRSNNLNATKDAKRRMKNI